MIRWAVFIDVVLWHFSNNPPNYASVYDAITFLIIMHSTFTGPFSGRIACIGVLGFGPRKIIHLLCFVPLVLICRTHLNICVESFHFFRVLLLCLDVLRYNLKIELFVLWFDCWLFL